MSQENTHIEITIEFKLNKRRRNIYLNHFYYEFVIELKTVEKKKPFKKEEEKHKFYIVPKIIGYSILLFIAYV